MTTMYICNYQNIILSNKHHDFDFVFFNMFMSTHDTCTCIIIFMYGYLLFIIV